MEAPEGQHAGLPQGVDGDDARPGPQRELDVALVVGEDALLAAAVGTGAAGFVPRLCFCQRRAERRRCRCCRRCRAEEEPRRRRRQKVLEGRRPWPRRSRGRSLLFLRGSLRSASHPREREKEKERASESGKLERRRKRPRSRSIILSLSLSLSFSLSKRKKNKQRANPPNSRSSTDRKGPGIARHAVAPRVDLPEHREVGTAQRRPLASCPREGPCRGSR